MQRAEIQPCPWSGLTEYLPYLRSWLARHVRDSHELEDVLQETMLRAARYRRRQRDPQRLRHWLTTIARNVLHDAVRRARRLGSLDSMEGSGGAPEGDGRASVAPQEETLQVGEERFERGEVLDRMRGVFHQISSADQSLLRSYYQDSRSCQQIGDALGVDAAVVKVRLFRARRRLARRIQRSFETDASLHAVS